MRRIDETAGMPADEPFGIRSAPNQVRTADGTTLFVRDWGEGRPVLFLSGWTLNADMWAYQMEPLSRQGLRCIAYDRRGHGRSSDPGRGYDYDTLADDLAAVLAALDLSDVMLVGHSFASGEIVRYLTRHAARRIGRVVLVSPAAVPYLTRTPDNPVGVDAAVFERLREMLLDDFPGWAETGADAYFVPGTSRPIKDWTVRMMMQTTLQAALALSRIQTATDFRGALAGIAVPTLVVHGDRDASAPLDLTGRPAAALIPGARLAIYEDGPHGLYFTHKERLNRDLLAFAGAVP